MEELNVKDEVFEIKLTEWEVDTLKQALCACRFPGTHLDLCHALFMKIKNIDKNKE